MEMDNRHPDVEAPPEGKGAAGGEMKVSTLILSDDAIGGQAEGCCATACRWAMLGL